MKYTYAYKTPDGVRHEGTISASSREEVFEALRGRGIKAIKVVAADGSKANGEVLGVRKRIVSGIVILVAFATGLFSYIMSHVVNAPKGSGGEASGKIIFSSPESESAFTNLQALARDIVSRHRAAIDSIDLDILTDYRFIAHSKDTSLFKGRIEAGYRAVDAARLETRNLFRHIFTIFPADCAAERTAAQRLYAQTMDAIDLSEDRIVNDESAFRLLDANRDKWHSARGKVMWTDTTLANEFEYFRHDVNPSSVRWRKDFTGAEPRIGNAQNGK